MSGGAFRDAGAAAIERVSILEQEKVDLEAEVAKLRAELGNGSHQDASSTEREISRLKVQLAAERADLKEALVELNPLTEKLETAQRAFRQAKYDRELAVDEASKAARELELARGELAAARDEIRDLRAALNIAQHEAKSRVEIHTQVPENLNAYMQRIQDERDELLEEIRRLKDAASGTRRRSLFDSLFGRR